MKDGDILIQKLNEQNLYKLLERLGRERDKRLRFIKWLLLQGETNGTNTKAD